MFVSKKHSMKHSTLGNTRSLQKASRNNDLKSVKYLSNKLKLVILIEMALTELLLKSLLRNKFRLNENLGVMSNTLDVNV